MHLRYIDRFLVNFRDFSALPHQNRLSWYNGYARIRYLLEPEQGLSVNAAAAIALGGAGPNERLRRPAESDPLQGARLRPTSPSMA